MSVDFIRQSIETRLNGNWTDTPIAYENTPFTPEKGEPFIAPYILTGEGEQASLGSVAVNRWYGLLDIALFVPLDSGTKRAMELVDQLIKLFYHYEVGGLTFLTGSWERLGQDDNWYRYSVSIPFQYDEIM